MDPVSPTGFKAAYAVMGLLGRRGPAPYVS